ncbi:MAG: hypothetical protein FWH41_02025 [Treponema sp.]|nr:hypothetical protein [Treponema sp.]
MKITEKYSHLNGLEYLLVHKPKLWKEIEDVIKTVDAEKCKNDIFHRYGKSLANFREFYIFNVCNSLKNELY